MRCPPRGLLALILFLMAATQAYGQSEATAYKEYVKSYMSGLRKFKNSRDSAFVAMMRGQWEDFRSTRGERRMESPKPDKAPLVADTPSAKPLAEPSAKPSAPGTPDGAGRPKPSTPVQPKQPVGPKPRPRPKQVTVPEKPKPTNPEKQNPTIPAPAPKSEPGQTTEPDRRDEPSPKEIAPIEVGRGNFSFDFHGTTVRLPMGSDMKFRLASLSDKSVADAFESLCMKDYGRLVEAYRSVKESLALNDYFYMLLIGDAADAFYGKGSDESALFTMFVAAQSGMKVRVARIQGRLALLYAASPAVYDVTYLELDGERYYIHNLKASGSVSLRTYRDMPAMGMKNVDLRLTAIPKLTVKGARTAERSYGGINVVTSMSPSLMELYTLVPTTDYEVYRKAPLSERMESDVIPSLRMAVDGKPEVEAVGIILSFVQRAFGYKTDHQQFGYERPFFPDENFYYPYNDCEDRSFLFESLVRRLVGLDVVVLSYPNHAATAVCFSGDVAGDAVVHKGKRYVVCDPTYIGAGIGRAMPDFRGVSPEINK